MTAKSFREMNEKEKKKNSLSAQVYRMTAIGSTILGLAALILGLGLYIYAVVNQYISESIYLSKSVSSVLEKTIDVKPLAKEVMNAYHGLSEEEFSSMGSDVYESRFAYLTKREDYKIIHALLSDFLGSDEVDDVYLAMYDAQKETLVYIVDPDETETGFLPGEFEFIPGRESGKFLNWDGKGRLYDVGFMEKYGWLCTSGTPIVDDKGETIAFVLTDISLANLWQGVRFFLPQYVLTMLILNFIFSKILHYQITKILVTPINAIADAAQTYARDRREGKASQDHFAKLNIRTGNEVENLSLIMTDMEKDIGAYETSLTRVTADKERIQTELSLANKIQADMLPSIYPAFPDRRDFDIYATMDPAREVGGDFYDYFLIDDDHLCVVMADVSGKGIPAALFMMAAKIILANNANISNSPAEILSLTNASICATNTEDMFVTVWLGILELSTGIMTAANGGHENPALMQADGQFELIRNKHSFLVGGMEGAKYRNYTLQLEPGARLFLYTDGLPEATNADNKMYGTERMLAALNKDPSADARRLLEIMRESVDAFVKDTEQFDDLTMLCLEYFGPEKK